MPVCWEKKAKPVLSGEESHSTRQSEGSALQAKPVLIVYFFSLIPYSHQLLFLEFPANAITLSLKAPVMIVLFAPDILSVKSQGHALHL